MSTQHSVGVMVRKEGAIGVFNTAYFGIIAENIELARQAAIDQARLQGYETAGVVAVYQIVDPTTLVI